MKLKTSIHAALSVAAAVSVLTAPSAVAATLAAGTSSVFSKQFSARSSAVDATHTQILNPVAITTTINPAVADVITITLSGAEFATNTTTATGVGGFGRLDCGGAGAETITSGTATTRVFTVATGGAANCTFDYAGLKSSSLTSAGNVQLAYSISRTGVAQNDAGAFTTVGTVVEELVASAAADARYGLTIDLLGAETGKRYTGGTQTDSYKLTVVNAAANTGNTADGTAGNTTQQVTVDSLLVTLRGDWNFLNNTTTSGSDGCNNPFVDNGNKLDVTRGDATTALAGTAAQLISATCSEIVISIPANSIASASQVLWFNLKTDNSATANVLPAQVFGNVTATFKYSTTNSGVIQELPFTIAGGEHAANGAVVFVPYMPVGAGISQVLQIVNSSTTAGTAEITARNQAGVACAAFPATTVGARRVVDLGPALAAGISACYGGAATTNKLYLSITAKIPQSGVEVYSAYNVSGNRVSVVNSSNGKKSAATALTGSSNATL